MIFSAISVFRMGLRSAYWIAPVFLTAAAIGFRSIDFFVLILCGLISGILSGYSYRAKKSVQFLLLSSAFALTAVLALDYAYESAFLGTDAAEQMDTAMKSFLSSSTADENQKKEFAAQYGLVLESAKNLVPFMFFLSGLFIAFTGFTITDFVFRRILKAENFLKGIETFKMTEWLIFILIASIAAFIFGGEKLTDPVKKTGLNLTLVLAVMYFIQSMGILKFMLMKKRIPVIILPLFFIGLSVFSIQAFLFSVMLMSGVGALDIWADFRKFSPKSFEDNKEKNKEDL